MNNEANKQSANKTYLCPYFQRERNGDVICECAKFRFPDRIANDEYTRAYCGSPQNYKECVLYKIMERYYWERKYKD